MATAVDSLGETPRVSTLREPIDIAIAAAALVLLTATLAALARGFEDWNRLPWQVWAHLLTIVPALMLTPVMLLRRRGDRRHRRLGYVWVGCMVASAAITFDIRLINDGGLSWIHLLSAWVLFKAAMLVRAARRHDIRAHRSTVRGLTIGGLAVAGFFTFPFGRLMGTWLFG